MSNSRIRQLLFELGIKPEAGGDIPVYIFPSGDLKHVWTAIQKRLWAVSTIDPEQLPGRTTKAKQMPIGANGLFYCSDVECFAVPFLVQSRPDPKEINGIWPGTWYFPFEIDPLGDLSRRIPLSKAKATWKTLEGARNVTTRINISGSMAFVPSWLYEEDWQSILQNLSYLAAPDSP
jgi:hypothetical protein